MTTKIEWATESWNPITGCTKISPGCANCYAERMAKRLAGRYGYPKDEPFRLTFHADKLDQPSKWRKPRMIFVCSMGDLFHEYIPFEWIARVFLATHKANHTYLLLTKRPERVLAFDDWSETIGVDRGCLISPWQNNIWLGVTAENQEQADKRIPILLQIPAAKRFVSIEPMLGALDIVRYMGGQTLKCSCGYHDTENEMIFWGGNTYECPTCGEWCTSGPALDWVILGGETGTGARPMDPQWARDVRDQCKAAGVPFFMKKMAGGGQPPDDLMIREYPA